MPFQCNNVQNQGGATTWTSDKDRCSTEQDSNIVGF